VGLGSFQPPRQELKEFHHGKQVQDAYIVAATRTPIGRSHRGYLPQHPPRRPAGALALKARWLQAPGLDPAAIEDIICGCAIPEAQQGLNVARIGAVLAGLPTSVGGITVNRFLRIGPVGRADGGRPHPRGRGRSDDRRRRGKHEHGAHDGQQAQPVADHFRATRENVGIAYGMGLTAEKVAQQWKVSREAQDAFALSRTCAPGRAKGR
jgi:acetyl-CoA acyltransferase